jgi:hypothetical protein
MNLGIEILTTKYCIFLNGGDEITSIKNISNMYLKMEDHLWGYGRAILYNPQSMDSRLYTFRPYSKFLHIFSLKYVPHCSTIFDSSFIKSIGGYDDTFGVAADQALILKFAEHQRPVTSLMILSKFYLGGTSTRSGDEIIKDFKFIEKYFYRNILFDFFISKPMWLIVSQIRKFY